ncbi:AGE family epimerase/isomerase [Puniceibacterium sp. IMCC21224]|uniref:AGE family epimerase/isomerase n=1 Tax=Puniceibacterium sp. IMCC21224 TaxID=1618204 RepID=UPI00065D2198|nr:AGE family epimerase/isomerase [Puniceibacterium sp. IMCC21224]KMK63963.1 N-acyl-D-glucosamine 2-epimerase [Puniceibacterium sp. IMCC21224]
MKTRRRSAEEWSAWFWGDFLTDWLRRVQDGQAGVFDALDADGNPDSTTGKSLLTQARTLFTLSHTALLSDDPMLVAAARQQAVFLDRFRKAPGLYRCMAQRDGSPTALAADAAARSYDHSFVILGLVTWHRVSPSDETATLINACWEALKSRLTDPETGLLLNDDTGAGTNPAQNPHMHLYEACLQANRMSGDAIWLSRAADLRTLGLRHFMDQDSGSIAEFLTPDLRPLPGADGVRREPGHQCEWAWLLLEEARLAGDPAPDAPAARLIAFADRHGFARDGALKGAAFDAVSAAGDVTENSFLLWPQTEAIKTLAIRHMAGDPQAGARARALLCLMFESWFQGRPSFVNRLDADGNSLWSQALTRLMYHLVLAMTEGARAGLWPDVPQHRPT